MGTLRVIWSTTVESLSGFALTPALSRGSLCVHGSPQERGVNPTLVPLLPREKGLGDEGLSVDEVILDRLVTLNAQRAEEERNGLVRWLRPDYQAPQETQVQQTIAGIAAPDEPIPVVPIEQLPFPKSFKDQLSAIRDLLRTHGGEWTATQIIAQFKNATRQKRAILESLEDLGILASHEGENNTRYWYLADLLKAS